VWLSYERKPVWQATDYLLEVTTLVSLIAALAGIEQSAVADALQAEFSRRKAEQANLLYSVKSTITNDCHPKESRKGQWTPSPEPYPVACDRIEHFLPQIELALDPKGDTCEECRTGWATRGQEFALVSLRSS
jgi:hypothetical protein